MHCTDLSEGVPVLRTRYETVIHAAGLAHVRGRGVEFETAMMRANVQGTRNLCSALEEAGIPKYLLFVSSVAVYGCETGTDIDECHPANPVTPYGRSKLIAEELLAEWCGRHNVVLTIVRPVLIYGTDAKGNLQDMRRGLQTGRYLSIGKGKGALKSIVTVEDASREIIRLLKRGGIYNICGSPMGFREIEAKLCSELGCRPPKTLPVWLARLMARIGDFIPGAPIDSQRLNKIIKPLTFKSINLH